MRIKILGSAAGGAFPQWNCGCSNCSRLRQGTLRGKPRSQAQVAVSNNGSSWYLLNASPDLRTQIEATPELHPQAAIRETAIAGIVLLSGDVDAVLGLLLLREFQPLNVYATASIRRILQDNCLFNVLQRMPQQVRWNDIRPGIRFELSSPDGVTAEIVCEAIALSGNYPVYVKRDDRMQLAEDEAVLGLMVASAGGKRLLYVPSLPRLDATLVAAMEESDLLLIDGTFWADDELARTRGRGPSAREIGHLPIAGADGTLQTLARVKRPRKIYIHVNNTNLILDEDSPEYRQVREAGWEVAEDGWEFQL
jgi:pyrroloquinoline quinone biosynthesis protein B